MNACKEDSCYVTLEWEKDMKTSQKEAAVNLRKNPDYKYKISRDYVLPDFTSIRRGYLKVNTIYLSTKKGVAENREKPRQAEKVVPVFYSI